MIKVEGDTVYVVTNHHVIEPKVIQIVPGRGRGPVGPIGPRRGPMFGPVPGPMPGPRGPSIGLTPRIIVQTLKNAKATVVLYSGTPKEEPRPAEVLAADPELDLAVLKASGVKELPQPIDLSANVFTGNSRVRPIMPGDCVADETTRFSRRLGTSLFHSRTVY